MKTCKDCAHSSEAMGYDAHQCRRRAPIAVHDPHKHCGVYQEAFVPRWPLMRGSDWCGDFSQRIPAPTPPEPEVQPQIQHRATDLNEAAEPSRR